MKRLTFEGNFCDIAMCGEVRGGSFCEDGDCSQRKTWERLKAIEDILCDSVGDNDPDAEDEYDLDRLAVMCNQRMTMRDEVSQRFSLTAKIPLDRLREIAEAERDGRCVVLPRLEPGHGDNPGAPGVPGPPGIAEKLLNSAIFQQSISN